jgi:N-acetylneuraminate synthase (EC 2.5.1.56)
MENAKTVRIGNKLVGHRQPTYIVAEIGINHNGSLDIAKKLIDAAFLSGCDAVKFQKRTIEVVYTPEELAKPRENPFGPTNGDLKRGVEFSYDQYAAIDKYCREKDIAWFASCWDEGAVDFIEQFNPPCYKIASACLTDDNLLKYYRKFGKPIILATGMADLPLIEHAVEVLGKEDLIILHCTSTYPSKVEELNLKGIITLKEKFPEIPIGYSGHEVGLSTSLAAVSLGACVIERHITLDRAMWGSDQAASVEIQGFMRLVRDIRTVEAAMGDGYIKIYDSEKPIINKLRRVSWC